MENKTVSKERRLAIDMFKRKSLQLIEGFEKALKIEEMDDVREIMSLRDDIVKDCEMHEYLGQEVLDTFNKYETIIIRRKIN